VDVRYVPGHGTLLARSGRCLIVAVAPDTIPGLVDQLWQDLGRPDAARAALATVRRHAPGAGAGYLDVTTGHHETEWPAAVERVDGAWRLGAGELGTGSVKLPLVEGVVAAAVLEVADALPADLGPVPRGPVIDGIPPEILASTRVGDAARTEPPLESPVRPTTVQHPATAVGDTDHDHHTQRRDLAAAARVAPTPASGHLEQTTSDTVLAVRCHDGHLTDPVAPTCRSCGATVPAQEPQRVLRPPLGVLRLPEGEHVPLDRPVVLGRRPGPSGPGDWPHLVQLPVESTYLSRHHLRIDLDGWHVVARDLGSRGGTTLFAPGRDPEKIRGHEPHLLEHGTVVDLAGVYQVTFLTTPVAEVPAGEARL
jgi:hypothetical protein